MLKIFKKSFYVNFLIVLSIFVLDRISKIYVINSYDNNLGNDLFSSKYLNIILIWNDGIASAEEMQKGMKENLVGKTEAEDIIWWKMDEHHHQSIIIFPSEDVAKAEFEKRQEMRNKTTSENNMKMVEEIMGPILSQLSIL